MKDEGIVIRSAFNNQMWQGRCKRPFSDPRCYQCTKKRIDVGALKECQSKQKEDENGHCIFIAGENCPQLPPQWGGPVRKGQAIFPPCIESILCIEYFWENFRKSFSKRAVPGQKVFFVFKEQNDSYMLWGRTELEKVGNGRKRIYLQPFKPLEKWIKGLRDIQLVGERWGSGTYRYINESKVNYLKDLIEREKPAASE